MYGRLVQASTGGKTLLLMRHAKSDWDADYERDHERPLNVRGVRSAKLMGRLVSGLDLQPDLVLASPARRARETARLAAESGGWRCPIVEEPDFYGGGADSVLEIAARSDQADRLMLLGHEPAWSKIAGRLCGRAVEMKTATVAVIELPISGWEDLPLAKGILAALHHPRSYFGSEWDTG